MGGLLLDYHLFLRQLGYLAFLGAGSVSFVPLEFLPS